MRSSGSRTSGTGPWIDPGGGRSERRSTRPTSSASSTRRVGGQVTWSSARPAACPATCSSSGGPVDPKGYHLEYGYSCMGYEIAGGLGVKMAAPDREVFVMVGDGSYLMLHTEIVTSIEEGRKITIVLLDNGGFGCIRGLQMANGTPSFGTELRFRDESTGRRPDHTCRSTSGPTPRRWAPWPSTPAPPTSCATPSPRRRRPTGSPVISVPTEPEKRDARLRVVVGRAGCRRERPEVGPQRPDRATTPSGVPSAPTHPADIERSIAEPGSSSSARKRSPK